MGDFSNTQRDDRELRASDEGRFKALRDWVREDISNRKTWAERARKNRELRYKRQATKKPLYQNAPNLAEPLIDDMIREIRTAEVSLLWQSARLAQFTGIDAAGVKHAAAAERTFDFHLRHSGRARKMIAQLIDTRLMIGFSIGKVVDKEGRNGVDVPSSVEVSPFSFVVPTDTDDVRDAERCCHILRYSTAQYWRAARDDGWDTQAARIILRRRSESVGGGAAGAYDSLESDEDGEGRARWRDEKLPESHGKITLWEIYYRTADAGRRVCLIHPEWPELPLYDRPWVWPAVPVTRVVQTPEGLLREYTAYDEPPERNWPFVQFRNEDADGFYAPRGVPEIIELDQAEASSYRTVRAIAMDFCGKPYLSGQKRSTNPFRFRAGEYLDGQEIVWAESPLQKQIYQQEYARQQSARRVGSPQSAMSSTDPARGDKKTATEVVAQSKLSTSMSADSVDRFGEPFAELFTMMWTQIARTARITGGVSGLTEQYDDGGGLGAEAWAAEYCISAGVSGRTANQWQLLSNMQAVLPYIQVFPQVAQFVRQGALAEWLFNLVDAELAKAVVVDMEAAGMGAAPIEQMVAQLGQVVGQHHKYLEAMAQADAGAAQPAGEEGAAV